MNLEEMVKVLNFSTYYWQILTPIIFNCADVVTGYIQAVINKDVDSSKMREGLLHKCLLIIIVILSVVSDFAFSLNIISKVVCCYIVLMEITSILENIQSAGIDLGKLATILKINRKEEK